MKNDELAHLSQLNQILLTAPEQELVRAFVAEREREAETMRLIDTAGIEPTVHVMPVEATLREDVIEAHLSREEMFKGAIETDAGYFCVPRVLE